MAQRRLRIRSGAFHVGLNDWYAVRHSAAAIVLKVRHGVVQEIGIADNRMIRGYKATFRFFNSFRHA